MSNPANIMAIPPYPPLPRNVSGAFPSVEQQTYPSAQKSHKGSPTPAAPTSEAHNSAMPSQRQHFSPNCNPIRHHPYAASYEAQHPRYTSRVRSNSGHASMMSSELATEFPRANISNARSSIDPSSDKPFTGMRPSASFNKDTIPFPQSLPRRNSVISHASSSASNESYQMHHHRLHSSPNNASMDLPVVPSGSMRIRHDSISSNASMSSASGRNGDSQCGERKYVCDWHGCTQAFDRVEHLNRHMRRHTGEKPYCCLVARCSKLFSRFDNMMQHVGIHSLEGTKTEIPNIKNLSVRGNGRGRARRTSYRGAGDPHEKFRRHVEGALGAKLAVSCILPTDNPDFSNLTLRPLLNVDPEPVEASTVPDQHKQQQEERKNSLSTLSTPPTKVSSTLPQQFLQTKRLRHDSVVDGMDNHHIVPSHSVVASSYSSSSGRDYSQQYPAKDNQAPSQWLSHRNSLGLVPSMAQVSNLRGQPSSHNNA